VIVFTKLIKEMEAMLKMSYASLARRVLALLIDVVVLSIVPYTVGIIIGIFDPTITDQEVAEDEFVNQFAVLWLGITLLYFLVLPIFWKGKTVGKKIVKIQLQKVSGENVTLWVMVKRIIIALMVVPLLLSTFLSIYTNVVLLIVGVTLILFRADKRSFHDLIAGTHVVVTRKKEEN
jgi:uncharacterized RDD family membrane protein YckC